MDSATMLYILLERRSAEFLYRAISNGDVVKVREELTKGKGPLGMAYIEDMMTPLMYACCKGNLDVVKCIIEEFRANIDFKNEIGWTALMYACSEEAELSSLEVVRYLVERTYADTTMESEIKQTPLSIACEHRPDIAMYLIDSEVPIDTSERDTNSLILAASYGHFDLVKHILETGQVDVNTQDEEGETALMACEEGHLDIVKYLIERHQADVNILDKSERSFIDKKVETGDIKIARYVLSREYPEGLNHAIEIFDDALSQLFDSETEDLQRPDFDFIALRLLRYGSNPFTIDDDTVIESMDYDEGELLNSYRYRYLLIVLTAPKVHPRLVTKNTFIRILPLDLIKSLLSLLVDM